MKSNKLNKTNWRKSTYNLFTTNLIHIRKCQQVVMLMKWEVYEPKKIYPMQISIVLQFCLKRHLQVGRHSLYHCGRAGADITNECSQHHSHLHSENRYLEGKAIYLISKTHIHEDNAVYSCLLYKILFEVNRQNPPEEEGELGNSWSTLASTSFPSSSFAEEPPKSPK